MSTLDQNYSSQVPPNETGLCAEVVSALTPSCSGVGAEIDCHPRNMPIIVALLNPGGHHFRVAASSTEWGIGHESLVRNTFMSEYFKPSNVEIALVI